MLFTSHVTETTNDKLVILSLALVTWDEREVLSSPEGSSFFLLDKHTKLSAGLASQAKPIVPWRGERGQRLSQNHNLEGFTAGTKEKKGVRNQSTSLKRTPRFK